MSIIFKGNLTDHFTADDYTINQTSDVALTQESYEHALMLEEFRQWLKRPIVVHAWYRTASYNKKVGGASNSSHLKGLATDWHTNITITEEKFIKYAKKWKEICERHNCVGEAVYICKRTGEAEGGTIVLQFLPSQLVGQYFEIVEV